MQNYLHYGYDDNHDMKLELKMVIIYKHPMEIHIHYVNHLLIKFDKLAKLLLLQYEQDKILIKP